MAKQNIPLIAMLFILGILGVIGGIYSGEYIGHVNIGTLLGIGIGTVLIVTALVLTLPKK